MGKAERATAEGEAGCRSGRHRRLNALLRLASSSFLCLTQEFMDRVLLRKTVVLRSGWEVLPESSSSQGTPAGRAGRGSGGSVLAPFTRSLSLAPAGFRCLRG